MKGDPTPGTPSPDQVVQAAYDGDVARLRALLAAGGDPTAHGEATHVNRGGDTRTWTGSALGAAVGRLDALRLLLDAGASPDTPDAIGRAPLHYAALQADLEATALLLKRGADPNGRDADEDTPLHFLGYTRNEENALELAKLLVKRGADARARNAEGKQPAAVCRHADAKGFLQREARKHATAVFPSDPAHRALAGDLERRIDTACRAAPRSSATHDDPRHRDARVLVYRTGKHAFARIDRDAAALELRMTGATGATAYERAVAQNIDSGVTARAGADGWLSIPFAEVPEPLRLLVDDAVRAATAPSQSRAALVRHHPVLRAAADMALVEERRAVDAARAASAAPMPTCSTEELAAIALWIAAQALAVAPNAEAAALLERAGSSFNYNALADAAHIDPREHGSITVARRATGAAAALLRGQTVDVSIQAMGAASRIVPLVREQRASPTDVAPVRDLLLALDQRILAGAMRDAAKRRTKIDLRARRVLWREKDLWVGELEDGRFAFVGKSGARWTAQIGTRDEALACVPDDAFAAATETVLNPR